MAYNKRTRYQIRAILYFAIACVFLFIAARREFEIYACQAGADRGPYAGRLSDVDRAVLIHDCIEGK